MPLSHRPSARGPKHTAQWHRGWQPLIRACTHHCQLPRPSKSPRAPGPESRSTCHSLRRLYERGQECERQGGQVSHDAAPETCTAAATEHVSNVHTAPPHLAWRAHTALTQRGVAARRHGHDVRALLAALVHAAGENSRRGLVVLLAVKRTADEQRDLQGAASQGRVGERQSTSGTRGEPAPPAARYPTSPPAGARSGGRARWCLAARR